MRCCWHTGHGQGSLTERHSSCHFGWETLLKALPHLTGVLPRVYFPEVGAVTCLLWPLGPCGPCHSSCHFGWETLLKALPHLTGVLPRVYFPEVGAVTCLLWPLGPCGPCGPASTHISPSPAGFTQLGTCRRPWDTTVGISTTPRNPDSPDPMWMASCLQRLWLL